MVPLTTNAERNEQVESFERYIRPMIFVGISLLVWGCAPKVGDSCTSNLDCGAQITCDLSQPGGYCTVQNCLAGSCPDESVCVTFSNGENWCMGICNSGEDCRSGYECLEDMGPHPFCSPIIEGSEE